MSRFESNMMWDLTAIILSLFIGINLIVNNAAISEWLIKSLGLI